MPKLSDDAVKFIEDRSIIDKFETLAEYIPKEFQTGHIPGLREEVDDFIQELKELVDEAKS
jgi:hypothetical protein